MASDGSRRQAQSACTMIVAASMHAARQGEVFGWTAAAAAFEYLESLRTRMQLHAHRSR